MTNIISCELHDHIELACIRRTPYTINLTTGNQLTVIAIDTQVIDHVEYLLFQNCDDPACEEQSLRLTHISSLSPVNNDT